jgi:tetratricopeptide (TPR) repeat protein
VRGHDAVLIASQGGVNFYIGNNPESDGRTAIVPGTRPTWEGGYEDAIARAEKAEGRRLKPSEVDRWYLGQGLAFLVRQPGAALRLYALKLRLLLGAGERSNNNNPYFWSKWSPVLRWPVWLGWAPILLLAVLGLFRRDLASPRRLLLLGAAAAYALSLLAFFINGRFRLPLLALLAIPAGGGLERLWSAARSRRWPDPRVGAVVALALFLISLSDLLMFRENRTDADPFSRFTLGNAYADAGNLAAARAAYEDALAVQRRYQVASFSLIEEPLYTSLGRILLGQNQPEAAVRLYTDWVRADPTSVAGRIALGDLLLQLGRADDAAAQFETALRMAPDDPRAALGYAWILRANGDAGSALRRYGEAAQTFEDLLRRQPDYWQALGNLAGAYDRLGREAEARQAYRRLLSLHPGDPLAQRWLAEHPG